MYIHIICIYIQSDRARSDLERSGRARELVKARSFFLWASARLYVCMVCMYTYHILCERCCACCIACTICTVLCIVCVCVCWAASVRPCIRQYALGVFYVNRRQPREYGTRTYKLVPKMKMCQNIYRFVTYNKTTTTTTTRTNNVW